MILVHWTGRAVSDNAKTTRDWADRTRNTRPYKAYRATVAMTIRSQHPGAQLDHPGLLVQFQLEGHRDVSNCLKGLLDGIQDSGLVANDRHIAPLFVAPTLKHPRGAQDEAWLCFWERER